MDEIRAIDPPLAGMFLDPAADPAFWRPSRLGVPSAWHGHVPFAFWLVTQLRPRMLVELGTHHGVSYAAFCEAVSRARLPTRCFAVDTWEGDPHAGFYDEQVFASFREFHDPRYGEFSAALRLPFDAAAAQLPDGEIDLLHIDGAHDYASVRHDFMTWLPKLSDRAVVLLHDTNGRERDFGVWRLWRELRENYAGFEFLHASGLGVLAVGARVPPAIADLCGLADPAALRRVRERFAALGERWEAENAALLAQARTTEAGPAEAADAAADAPVRPGPAASPPADASPATAADLRISVVIPLYQGARFIAEAIESVRAQTLPAAEIIVVDDGSTDSGPEIVQRLAAAHPVTLLRKQNGGQSTARNLGVAHASGTHIALLDQDDVWYPDHLQELARPFTEVTERRLGWTYANLDEIDEAGEMVVQSCLRMLPFHHPKRDLFACLGYDMFILPSASLIAREAFDAVGGFDEALCGYEDDDLFLRMFRAGYDNRFIDRAVTRWRIHRGSSSYSFRMAESRMIYLRKLLAAFPDDRERGRYYARDLLAPRFLPNVAQEYRKAVETGDPAAIRAAAGHLAVVARLHRWRIRLLVATGLPALRSPRTAPVLVAVLRGLRPLLRWVLGMRPERP